MPQIITVINININFKYLNNCFFIYRNGRVFDSESNCIQLAAYGEVYEVMSLLKSPKHGDIKLGVASRIADIAGAYQLLHLLNLSHYFNYKQIYPGKKIAHFFQ